MLHISSRGYQRYERGEFEIPTPTVDRAKEHFGLNPHWLLDGIGEMFLTSQQGPEAKRIRQTMGLECPAPEDAPLTDLELMEGVIRIVLTGMQRRNRIPEPAAFAKACVAIYEFSKAAGAPPAQNAVERLLETMK